MSDDRDREIVTGGSPVNVRAIIGILIVLGVGAFVFQNTEQTSFDWLFFNFDLALWVYTLIIFAAGALVGWVGHVRRTKQNRKK